MIKFKVLYLLLNESERLVLCLVTTLIIWNPHYIIVSCVKLLLLKITLIDNLQATFAWYKPSV